MMMMMEFLVNCMDQQSDSGDERRRTTTTTIATLVSVYLHKDAHKLNCGLAIVDGANN